ncbi:Endocuticle structural glycoprotein SgAbd-9 [Cryptotermes secundus]|uniref:Endocuticle structural glycoprotein SgAbd-9 n=2 Tax=Cryptotermes secundus TaxID=105785 RepID=A0A2J7R775_9NEOP|nr:Endocuticle structural glycoprotein SgAbd-9 [Cryptotermes secundus]
MPAPQGPPPGRNFSPRFLPLTPQGYVPIVSSNFDLNPIDNSYNFNYVSGDGSERHEVGVLENPGTPVEGVAVQGSYSYAAPDGTPVTLDYVADNFGYQPVGPNIHPAIIRAVQQQVAEARVGAGAPPFRNNF